MHLGFSAGSLEEIKGLSSLRGIIKKKREKGSLVSMFSASTPRWFCFRGLGRFWVNYESDKKPGFYDRPEAVVFINEIHEILTDHEGKKGHFLVRLEKETIHLKCDEQRDKDKWVQSLEGLKLAYAGRKIFDWEDDRKSHKDEIDIRVLHLIMDEHEGNFCSSRGICK